MQKNISILLSLIVLLCSLVGCSSNEQGEASEIHAEQTTVQTEISTDEENAISTNTKTNCSKSMNNEISYGFLNHAQFREYWLYGTYRCGTDFPAGDYYIMSVYGAECIYGVSDSADGFEWQGERVLRKITAKEGQFVKIPSAGIMVSKNEFDTINLEKLGIFLVGKDLPEGDYRLTSITDVCTSDIMNVQGVCGGYQICNDSPDSEPVLCSALFENQSYISVKNGQYIIINNLHMELCGEKAIESDSEISVQENVEASDFIEEEKNTEAEFVRLPASEANTLINEEYDKFETLIDDLSEIFDYWNSHELSTVNEIETYEAMWKAMTDKAREIEKKMTENRPPEVYEKLWLEFRDCFSEVAAMSEKGEKQDFNDDGEYSRHEMYEFLKTTSSDIIAKFKEVVNISEKFSEIENPETSGSVPESPVTHICTECGKPAEQSVINTFSGETEYYCTEHYNELQSYMDQIMGKSNTQSTKSTETTEYNRARHTDKEAWTCAMNIVRNNLKAPATAKFCSFTDGTVTHLGNGEYKVTGWVDSQNGFGVMVRSNFTVTYTATERGYKNGSAVID